MRTFSGFVAPVRKEDRVKVVVAGQQQEGQSKDQNSRRKTRLRHILPLWPRKAGRTMRDWFAGCWGHKEEGKYTMGAGEPLLDGEYEEEHEEAERDRKLLCDERVEAFVPRHAALSFLKTATARPHGVVRSRKEIKGWGAVYA